MSFFHKEDEQAHDNYREHHLEDAACSQAVFIIINEMKITNKKWKKNNSANNSRIKIQPK